MSEQIKAALLRAIGQALLSGIAVLGASLATEQDLPTLGRNVAVSVITAFIWRAGLEGFYDQSRQEKGEVQAADVSR